jgi:hypothetical protein
MRRADRNSHRSPVKYWLEVVCTKHDDDQIHRQMRSQTCGKVRAPIELSAADRRRRIRRILGSAIKPFFDYLVIAPSASSVRDLPLFVLMIRLQALEMCVVEPGRIFETKPKQAIHTNMGGPN